MGMKRKPTFEQALGLEKGQATARANRRRAAAEAPSQTPEERAAWEARRKEALTAYRARRRAATEGGSQ